METLGMIIMVIGAIGLFGCSLWMLVLQFQTSILWGLGCIFIPFVALIWLVLNWDEGKMPFLFSLVFGAIMIGGMFMSGDMSNLPVA